jgi:hypothetical protein
VTRNRNFTHWDKIDRGNLPLGRWTPPSLLGHSWIGHFISSKCVLIFAQNTPNMSIYSSIRRECFRTGLRDSGVAIGQTKFPSPSGRESTEKKHRRGDCCIREEYWPGEKRKGFTTLISYLEVIVPLVVTSPSPSLTVVCSWQRSGGIYTKTFSAVVCAAPRACFTRS